MRWVYVSLVGFAVVLSLVTIWALGYDAHWEGELARARRMGIPPETEAMAARLAEMERAAAPSATRPGTTAPSSRPAGR